MAAGSRMAMHGHGGPVRCTQDTTRFGRRRMCRSLAGAVDLDSESASADGVGSAGFRSDLVTGSIRGGAAIAAVLATLAAGGAIVGAVITATVGSRLCIAVCGTRT